MGVQNKLWWGGGGQQNREKINIPPPFILNLRVLYMYAICIVLEENVGNLCKVSSVSAI